MAFADGSKEEEKRLLSLKENTLSKIKQLGPEDIKQLPAIINHFFSDLFNSKTRMTFEEIKDDDYKTAYKNIETHLEAVKNTRGFDAFTEIGRKCSIDGKNNALLFGNKSKTPFYF